MGELKSIFAAQSIIPDEKLWDSFRSGDKLALRDIYKTRVEKLFNYGMKVTQDSLLVKDCIQDLFVDLWNRRNHLSPTTNIDYYLFKALRGLIIRALKKDKKLREKSQLFNNNQPTYEPSYEKELISSQSNSELRKKLRSEIGNLPDRQREILFLTFFESFSYEEASAIMKVDVKTAYNLAWRAIKSLRNKLNLSTTLTIIASIWLSCF